MRDIKKIGVVIADEYEYEPFVAAAECYSPDIYMLYGRDAISFVYGKYEITAVKCGIGKVNAAAAAAFLISDRACDVILNIGLSGAVTRLHKGDIVVGSSFVECDFDLTAIGKQPGEKPQDAWVYKPDEKLYKTAMSLPFVIPAVFGCGDIFLADPVQAKHYKDTFGIEEFDMETGAIASVCHFSGVPFLSLRQISDNADDAAPESYTSENEKKSVSLTEYLLKLVDSI